MNPLLAKPLDAVRRLLQASRWVEIDQRRATALCVILQVAIVLALLAVFRGSPPQPLEALSPTTVQESEVGPRQVATPSSVETEHAPAPQAIPDSPR
jgi:hypothetical protein